ncbi:hypothetical protein CEXT_293381 [Caerostris extrusa]|uniref:Uncharacterized protein n=1 Tax=Caerostris extrusa TaxID=172846 RepID=A0AAV4SSU5_CAEEX|nr:hypothetical protein CEXT_293381 [Caerostris extrusa]
MGLKSREKGRWTLAIISRGMFAPCHHISAFYQLSPLQQLVYRNRTTALENAVKGSINLIGENNSKYFLLFSSAVSPPIELQWADFTPKKPLPIRHSFRQKKTASRIKPEGQYLAAAWRTPSPKKSQISPSKEYIFFNEWLNIEKESSINPGPEVYSERRAINLFFGKKRGNGEGGHLIRFQASPSNLSILKETSLSNRPNCVKNPLHNTF